MIEENMQGEQLSLELTDKNNDAQNISSAPTPNISIIW